jgi:hypothetical protein
MANTILEYAGGLPTITGTVTLFNSATTFPPGGSLHLLRQDWYQYAVRVASDAGGATGTVTGSYSVDKGTTWVPFYTKSIVDADDDNAAVAADVIADEVFVGMFKDVRFQYTNAAEAPTVFQVNQALARDKAASKVVDGALLVDN